MTVKHLVLSGGGVRGFATIGAIHYLRRKHIIDLNTIRTYAGSSVGAIISLLLVCGYTPSKLYKLACDIEFKDMFEPDINSLISHFGFDTGAKFVIKIKELLTKKKIDPNITFIRLYNITKKKFIVTATSLNRKQTKYFDYIQTPQHRVIDVVRASMSIPILFTTVKQGNEHFVDGGLLDNFPLHLFKNTEPHSIIAIKFKKTQEYEEPEFKPINNLADVIIANITCLLEEIEQLRSELSGELYEKSSILIDTKQYHVLSFDVDDKDKHTLFKLGEYAAKQWSQSPKYIQLQLNKLPNIATSLIWNYIHRDKLTTVLQQLMTSLNTTIPPTSQKISV